MLSKVPHHFSLLSRLQALLARTWWVLSFALFCFCAHLAAVRSHHVMIDQLQALKNLRLTEHNHWAYQHKLWSMRLANCNNPAWLESILMRELGVSPKNTIKVVFKENGDFQHMTGSKKHS